MSGDEPKPTGLPSRLRAMSAEFDDPMCSNHPIQMLLEEAATEIEIWRARVTTAPIESPRPISTLYWKEGRRFIGLVRDIDLDGKPFWETIELLQFSGGNIFNCNSGNNSNLLKHLTHWMPEPPLVGMTSHSALLPCPFCGGEAKMDGLGYRGPADCYDVYVCCVVCDAHGPTQIVERVNGDTDAEAASGAALTWNRRPQSSTGGNVRRA